MRERIHCLPKRPKARHKKGAKGFCGCKEST